MTPRDDDREPDPLADVIASADVGLPTPDPIVLERIRELSTDAYLAAGQPPAAPARKGRSAMVSALYRLSAVGLAASVLVAAGVLLWPSPRPENPPGPLAAVLDRVADADSLHLRVTRDGHTGDVWVGRSNRLRWDESPERYLIAQGRKVFRIDEAANRVTPGTADYFRPDRPGLNVFALLDLHAPNPEAVRQAKPERAAREGRQVDVYRLELTETTGQPRAVEVEADPMTGDLVAVRSFAADQGGGLQLIAALLFLAQGQPLPEEKFAVKNTLAEDGRVGKVADVQGVVGIRPVGYSRWTPVRPNVLLKPGDWVRADVRGANATTLKLLPQATVVVGPGGLLEVLKPTQLRLHEGEAEIAPAKGTPIELLGPGGFKEVVVERAFYRVVNEQVAKAGKDPTWLKGYKGQTANESIGALVAKVDGRNVALSVGSHKVSVEIRDQIARTTVEETFVNHTDSRLEGQFHFPLPQDASISGFAMWIGDQMVEADVVEKQRAREIYEEIMRERRDPGLLEWTGGNIFKARVWPIEAHSEKRIRIVYTQVLPLQANKYRYSYALQSEMLQQHPLKELAIDLRVSSAAPLKSVTSPTHTVRADQTEHSARLEFAAQEHTPTRDFEAVIEVADAAPPVAVIPHRRGDDGYFLLQVTPPAAAAADRELVADAGPLDLRLVCDTSASIDPRQRANQHAVAAAVLDTLTPKDTFNLLACDVLADWAFDKPQPATPENVAKAREFLGGRVSLGWTDLDRAFDAALKQCGPRTHVVYLGDGIVTTGDANPQAFADRLKAMYKAANSTATFHAVALGSAFEPGVMKAIGSLGGGSVRRVTSEQGPVAVALELLGEITRPPVRDLKVEFVGWKTAKVYPEVLPNLVPGTQQVLIGRYLPEGHDQTGEVVVTGYQGGKPVRYSAKATLKDAEQGNSFLPRLWARMHLEKLLEQPQTDAVKDDVIALSEEFGIITPYTSFLVLESDADRERFKVKRRFQMRDGEKFFAEGRDKVEYDLARQQMKRAGDWRVGLRRTVLAQLATLGRDLRVLAGSGEYQLYERGGGPGGGRYAGVAGGAPIADNEYLETFGRRDREEFEAAKDLAKRVEDLPGLQPAEPEAGAPAGERSGFTDEDADEQKWKGRKQAAKERISEDDEELLRGLDDGETKALSEIDGRMLGLKPQRKLMDRLDGLDYGGWAEAADKKAYLGYAPYGYTYAAGRPVRGRRYAPQQWFEGLFPNLSPAAAPRTPPKIDWPKEARDLARSILRRDALAKLSGGLKIDRQTLTFDPRTGDPTGRDTRLELYSPGSWAVRGESPESQTVTDWCDGKQRGTFVGAFRLGRVRPADKADLRDPPLNVLDFSLTPLDETYHYLAASVEKAAGKPVLVLRQGDGAYEMRFTVDTERHVVLKLEERQHGKPYRLTTFADFVEAGGLWWAGKVEAADEKGRRTGSTTQAVAALPADDFAAQVRGVLAGRDSVQFLRAPAPSFADARKALAAGKAGFDEQFVLLNHYAGYQQWAKAAEHLDAAEKLAAGKPGVKWLRTVFLRASRRNEELRQRLLAEAAEVVKMPAGGDRLALATFLYGQAQSALAANEQLALLDRFQPVYADLPKSSRARMQWQSNWVSALQGVGRPEEALALQKQMAEEHRHDASVQTTYAQALYNRGDRDAAFAWLKKVLTPDAGWSAWEEESIRGQAANWLENEGRYPDLVEYLAGWLKTDPETDSAYTRYLSALVRSGEQEKAYDLMAKWLKDAQVKGEVPPAAQARFRAAVATATGRGHNLYHDRLDPRWEKPLADAARFFADHPTNYQLADAVLQAWPFRQTEAGRKIAAALLKQVAAGVAELPPPRLLHLLGLVMYSPPEADKATWAKLTDGLRARWRAAADPHLRHQLGSTLGQVLSSQVGQAAYEDFLRLEWKEGPEEYRPQYAQWLFDAILGGAWTELREAEAVALLAKLGDPAQPDARLAAQVVALHHLTDRMTEARYQALRKDLANPEKLTRTELAKKEAEMRAAARKGLAERLKKAGPDLPADLRPWAAAERIYLTVRADGDPKPLAAEVWAFLGDAPKPRAHDDQPTTRQLLDDALAERYLAMALYFAARPKAEPATVERALKYLDAGAAAEPTEPGWKSLKFQLLVALDRPKDLEAALAAWVKAGDADGRWKTALGYVLAEQGKLRPAIELFEGLQKSGDLGYAGHQALAGWYMAVNDRDAHEKALRDAFKMVDENTLNRLLYAKLVPWQRGGTHLPTELDKDVLRVLAVLFEKSSAPQNYLGPLQQFYAACRDFRLLAVMADAVVGQSAGKVYPFLQGMQGVLNEVRDEAAADELLKHIDELRQTAQGPTDLRALDLLEMQVRRRAAEQINQPGPHAEKALAAMRRAFDRPWADGEPLMMSNLLRDLGHITRKELAAEQLRELNDLHGRTKPGTFERLHTAHNHATALGYYARHKEGVAELEEALAEYARPHNGVLPTEADAAVMTLVGFHEALRQYAAAEELLQGLIKNPGTDQHRTWLSLRLDDLYHRALGGDHAVSLGSGAKLYAALEKRMVKELDTTDPNYRNELIGTLCGVYRTAKSKGFPNFDADLKTFAHKTLPPYLKKQAAGYENVVSQVAYTLRELIGPGEAVAFLVDRIEQEPAWFKLNNQDGWSRHGWALGQWRTEAKVLPFALEARLLKLVLAELREDLRSQRQRGRVMYWAGNSYYWPEKEPDFARVAEEVYAERKDSGPAVLYVADYLYHGCNQRARAIEVLLDAHARMLLDDGGQVQLVRYLHEQNRHEESIAILVPLVARVPDDVGYRGLLCTAYFHAGRIDKLTEAFAAAEEHFRRKDRWGEGPMSALAQTAVNCRLYGRAAAILGELIPLHQRTAPARGIGDGALSHYYQLLARSQSALGKPLEAIDAASGAIVSWGPRAQRRAEALQTLREVVTAAQNLDEVVRQLDAQTAETNLVNPVVRKAVARAYHDKGQLLQAVNQLQMVLSAQPADAEALKLLTECYDKMKNAEGAAAQVLRATEANRRDIKLYENLGQRYLALGRPAEAERAFTSIVEVTPNESEGHQLLAEVRQRQDRWAEAAKEWEQVARIRALEPTGLLGLAAAQLHLRKFDAAAATIAKLKARTWPAHFGNTPGQVADLERQLRDLRK